MTEETNHMQYRLTIELLEDLHSGTGMGGQGLDAVQAVDRRGLPVLRSTHVRGVLRASAEELVRLENDNFETRQAAKRLFGHPGTQVSALVMTSFFMNTEGGATRQPPSIVWSSTDRAHWHRTPRSDFLRSIEFVPAGSVFEGDVLINEQDLVPLFEQCVKRTDRFGSSRTRGAGHVKITCTPIVRLDRSDPQAVPKGTLRPVLRLILKNLDPLCFPTTGNPGNIIPSECYIRGQVMRGAIAAWARQRNRDPEILFDRRVSVGNGYPLPPSALVKRLTIPKFRVHPIPLGLHTPKTGSEGTFTREDHIPWWAFGTGPKSRVDRLLDDSEKVPKPKRPKDSEFLFRSSDAAPWMIYRPVLGVHMRNKVPRSRNSEDAELFSTTEIAEQTRFLVDICFPDREAAERFAKMAAPVIWDREWLTMGRGGCPVEVEERVWMSPFADNAPLTGKNHFRLTLDSDLIARSKTNLAFYHELGTEALKDLLSMENLTVKRSFSESIEVRGFNAASGLPRATVVAIRRGSDFLIGADNIEEVVERLRQKGVLGERTWEGFGRFVLELSPPEDDDSATPPDKRVTDQADCDTLPHFREEEILALSRQKAQDIRKAASSCEHGGGKKRLPSRSQWQSLRQQANIASTMNPEQGFRILTEFLAELIRRTTTVGGAAWKNAHLGDIRTAIDKFNSSALECEQDPKPAPSKQDLEDACLYLDTLVRWILPEMERS